MKRFAALAVFFTTAAFAQQAGNTVSTTTVNSDSNLNGAGFVGGACTNYTVTYVNNTNGHIIRCVNTNPLSATNVGVWTVVTTGASGASAWGGISGQLTNQTDLVSALAAKQNLLTTIGCSTGQHISGFASNGTFSCSPDSGGGGGTTYNAGTGLNLVGGNTFQVLYGTTGTTAAAGNDSRIVNALQSSFFGTACTSGQHVSNITVTGPVCTSDTGGGVTLPSTSALLRGNGSGGALAATSANVLSLFGTITTGCYLDGTGACSTPAGGGGSANITAGSGTGVRPTYGSTATGVFFDTSQNPGMQFSFWNGTAWVIPGLTDGSFTRDTSGRLSLNPSVVALLGQSNHFTGTTMIDSLVGSDGNPYSFTASLAVQQAGSAQGSATTLNCGANVTCGVSAGVANISVPSPTVSGIYDDGAVRLGPGRTSTSGTDYMTIATAGCCGGGVDVRWASVSGSPQINFFSHADNAFGMFNETAGAEVWTYHPATPVFSFALAVQTAAGAASVLPTCNSGTEGAQKAVTDASVNTWGSTFAGGGTNHILAYCNGTAWTVMAK